MSGPYVDDEEKGKLLDSPPRVPKSSLVIPRKIPLLSLVASVSYGFASLTMVFLNKAVLQQYRHSMTLLTLQQAATALLIYFGGKLGIIVVRNLDWKTSRKLLPLSLFYNANVAFALASLKGINVPMYIALKRLTPLTVLLSGFFYGKAKPSVPVIGDWSLIHLWNFHLSHLLMLVERSGTDDGLSSTELMLFNSVLSLPFLTLFVIGTGEFTVSVPELLAKMASLSFALMVIMSLVMGIVLNFTMFLCTIVNSALTTTIVGVLKGVGSTILGFVLLGGVEVHALNVTGLVINTLGGISYSFVKYQEKAKRKIPILLPPTSKHLS